MKLFYFSKEINSNRPRSELPEEVFNVHGHTEEVDNIVKALSGDSSKTAGVLVSGIAGVGKSTVAIQAGHRLKNEFESIVKFCSLRGACKGESEDDGALREILNVCAPGHQPTSENPKHVLLNWCRRLECELILIVDNAEDAIENRTDYSLSNLLSDMRKCSDCKIKFLITSRRSDIDNATTGSNIKLVKIGLVPLNVKESVQVLKDGANLTSGTDPKTEVKLRKIAELCENIPLALRLAGPLLAEESEYTFEGLIQELEINATETLDLKPMMKIAFEKLDELLKRALVCLSVFARSFKRDAAEALLDDNCAKYLTKLKQRCLIQKQGDRYLIHLLIRGYARQIGESEEFRPIVAHGQQNFLEHFLSLILENSNKYWGKDTCKESFNLFHEERLNLESTLRDVGQKEIRNCSALENVVNVCRQVAPYIEYCAPFKLYDDFLNGLLRFCRCRSQRKVDKEVEILCLLYHESRKHGGDKQKSKDLIRQAIKLHDDNRQLFYQDSLSEVFYLSHYGRYLSQDCKKRDEAQTFLKAAISIFEKETAKHDSTFDKGRILGQMGHSARLDKNENEIRHEEALACYQEALDFRQIHYGEHLVTAFAHKDLADYYLSIENLDKAEENYKKAIRIFEDMEIAEQKEAVPTYKNFGRCHQKSKKIDQSRIVFEKGSDVADNTMEGDHKWKVWIKTYLALLLYENYPDEVSEADKLSEEVLQMGKKLGLEEWDGKEELEKKFYKKE